MLQSQFPDLSLVTKLFPVLLLVTGDDSPNSGNNVVCLTQSCVDTLIIFCFHQNYDDVKFIRYTPVWKSFKKINWLSFVSMSILEIYVGSWHSNQNHTNRWTLPLTVQFLICNSDHNQRSGKMHLVKEGCRYHFISITYKQD